MARVISNLSLSAVVLKYLNAYQIGKEIFILNQTYYRLKFYDL
jgi:hypothetical protein